MSALCDYVILKLLNYILNRTTLDINIEDCSMLSFIMMQDMICKEKVILTPSTLLTGINELATVQSIVV